MWMNASQEASSCADTQELSNILWNPEVHYHVHKSLPLVPILIQISPWRIPSPGMLRHVALVRTNVSVESSASIIRGTRLGELNSMRRLPVRLTLFLVHRFSSPWWWRCHIPPKRRFLQEPHGVTSQKTPFFISDIICTMDASINLNWKCSVYISSSFHCYRTISYLLCA
jgi:hypothetical protein